MLDSISPVRRRTNGLPWPSDASHGSLLVEGFDREAFKGAFYPFGGFYFAIFSIKGLIL